MLDAGDPQDIPHLGNRRTQHDAAIEQPGAPVHLEQQRDPRSIDERAPGEVDDDRTRLHGEHAPHRRADVRYRIGIEFPTDDDLDHRYAGR
nr:hypothetical protein [Actinoplanes sp. ATCC 53533]